MKQGYSSFYGAMLLRCLVDLFLCKWGNVFFSCITALKEFSDICCTSKQPLYKLQRIASCIFHQLTRCLNEVLSLWLTKQGNTCLLFVTTVNHSNYFCHWRTYNHTFICEERNKSTNLQNFVAATSCAKSTGKNRIIWNSTSIKKCITESPQDNYMLCKSASQFVESRLRVICDHIVAAEKGFVSHLKCLYKFLR